MVSKYDPEKEKWDNRHSRLIGWANYASEPGFVLSAGKPVGAGCVGRTGFRSTGEQPRSKPFSDVF